MVWNNGAMNGDDKFHSSNLLFQTISQTPPYANVTKENIVHHLVSRTDHIEGLSFRVTKAVSCVFHTKNGHKIRFFIAG